MLFLPSSVRLFLCFSLLTTCLAAAGWKAPKRHWLAQTSTSLVCYLLLPSISSLLYPRPHLTTFLKSLPLELGCPRKYFRVETLSVEKRIHRTPDFYTFFTPSSISADRRLADPFPFTSTSTEHMVYDHEIFRRLHPLSTVRIFLPSRQPDYINICHTIMYLYDTKTIFCDYKRM